MRASRLAVLVCALGCSTPAPAPDASAGADASVDAPAVDAADLDAGPLRAFADIGATSEGIALGRTLDGAPVLYVGARDDRIVRIAPDGVVGDFVSIASPVGIAVRPDGTLLVCASQGGAPGIFAITPDGVISTLVAAGPGGVPFGLTNFVLPAPDGSIVFSDSSGNALFRADADGANVALVTSAISFPNGLAFSPSGDTLYVASWDTDTLWALSFDRTTGAYGAPTPAITGVRNVDGVVAASGGALVLVTSSAGVLRVDPASPSAAPVVLATVRDVALPANGAFGDTAFGTTNLYLSVLGRQSVYVLHTDLMAP